MSLWIELSDFRVAPFLPPSFALRLRQQSDELFERLCKHAVPWDEDKTKFEKAVVIQASTWNPPRLFRTKPRVLNSDKPYKEQYKLSPCGEFAYLNRILPRGVALDLFQGHKRGKVGFDGDVVIPILARGPNGSSYRQYSPWMSITPAECLSQRSGVRAATGTVVLGGLGMGWLLRKIAEKRSVKKIIVVEISQGLLDWFGTDMCQKVQEDTGTPVEVVCDDVLNHMGRHGDDARYLVDIWDNYPQYRDSLPKEWREAISRVKYFWGWGVLSDPANYRW